MREIEKAREWIASNGVLWSGLTRQVNAGDDPPMRVTAPGECLVESLASLLLSERDAARREAVEECIREAQQEFRFGSKPWARAEANLRTLLPPAGTSKEVGSEG